MRRMALFVGLVAAAFPLLAQTSSTTAAAVDRTSPALLSDLTVSPNDSKLVRAAKLAVARRRALAAGSPVWHVDDSMVSHRMAASSPSSTVPLSARSIGPAPPAPGYGSATTISTDSSGPSAAQLTERKQALQREQARMAEENDQPYAGDVPENVPERRLTEIPAQINAIDNKLQPMQPPTPPPPQ